MARGFAMAQAAIATASVLWLSCESGNRLPAAISSGEVETKVTLSAETITAGAPVWIRFRLLNGENKAVEVGVDDGEPKDLTVSASDSEGRQVGPPADYRKPTCGLWYSETVEPGETLERGVLLNRRFRLDEPGDYVITARYRSPLRATEERPWRPMNLILKLRVTPRAREQLKALAEDLAATACRDGAEPWAARLAARALATIDDPVARPYLEQLLGCSDFLVRLEGVAGLQREGSPAAMASLIAAAEAPDEDLAGLARGALEVILRGPRPTELPPDLVARARAAVGKERIQ